MTLIILLFIALTATAACMVAWTICAVVFIFALCRSAAFGDRLMRRALKERKANETKLEQRSGETQFTRPMLPAFNKGLSV